ncbi:hypothetical protein F2Q69_00016339 [Brassica cretica]|uniref:Uncharacterized protein n=1 Tax=Brassica cretica TaxID=69181 RepID=A0A8S9QNQ9_BRACR|nr:hypothetical protein F2Q69_00016339 [Brassica cretica]
MSSRRVSLRESERIRGRNGSVGVERIHSGDVSEALIEVLCEEIRLPRAPVSGEGKDLGGEKVVVRTSSNSPNGSQGRDRPPKKAKVTGADHRPCVSGDSVAAKPFHWQFSHSKDCPITEDPDSVAHLDVPRSDELYEINKIVRELKLGLKMAQDRESANASQLAAAEKLGNQAASLEARFRFVSNKRKLTLEQKALADNYLDVLISLKEKWEKKKAATDCEARLKEEVELGCELDVMAVSEFSVGKLDLPQISEDLPEEFFAKVPSKVNEPGDETKRAGDRFEDGEFDAEE